MLVYVIEYSNTIKFFTGEIAVEVPKDRALEFGQALKNRAKKEHIKIILKNLL